MLGIAGNGVAIAEDLTRSMQFYVVLSKNYLGSKDACLVFDKNGRLMAGSEMIGTMDTESKPVIVQLPNTSQYAIVTLSATTKQAVYHIVDMSRLGYGPVVNSGSVISVNNILDQSMNGALHGYHFTGVEDHINGHAIVYGTKFKTDANDPNKGTTAVMAYNFGTATLSPVASTLNTVYGCGNTERGELQISPEGNKLTWWRYDKNLAGFAHRTGELRTMPLTAARTGLNGSIAVRAISNAGSYGNGMFDFMKNNKDIFYSQRGLYQEGVGTTQYDRNVWKYEPVNLSSLAINPSTSPLVSYLFGEVKRGIDGNYYIPNMGRASDQIHNYNGTGYNNYSYSPDTMYKLASALPTQVFKIFDNTATLNNIVRSVGNKDYELKDHLGNVRVVISDAKLIEDADMSLTVSANDLFKPEVKNYTDYYAFGMVMPGRSFNGGDYRYGYQAQETKSELWTGAISFTHRLEDPRIGRFFSIDPLFGEFAWNSTYAFSENRVIDGFELEGLEVILVSKKDKKIYNAAIKMKDTRKVVNLVAHGNPWKIVNSKKNKDIVTAEDFDQMMLSESEEYRQARKEGTNIVVILHSCRTGRMTIKNRKLFRSIAQVVSTLPNVTVIAPTERVCFAQPNEQDPGSAYEVGPRTGDDTDRNGDWVKPETETYKHTFKNGEKGTWITYKDGKYVEVNEDLKKAEENAVEENEDEE